MSDKIKPSEVSDVLLQQLQEVNSGTQFDEVGTVLTVGDGVARIYGLRNAEASELLEFENGTMALSNGHATGSSNGCPKEGKTCLEL